MSDPHKRILCINLGTRYLGVAAFQGQDLRDWRVRSFNEKWSRRKEGKILGYLEEWLDTWQPDVVAMKEMHPARGSEQLHHLAAGLERILSERRVRQRSFSIESLKGSLLEGGPQNKKALGEALIRRWPALAHELRKERESKNPYYQRMFEAVALGSACLKSLNKQQFERNEVK